MHLKKQILLEFEDDLLLINRWGEFEIQFRMDFLLTEYRKIEDKLFEYSKIYIANYSENGLSKYEMISKLSTQKRYCELIWDKLSIKKYYKMQEIYVRQ